ncbi:MAG: hypothetical protein HXL00_05335 [Candidatus Nanosynbacter sp.]|nr:hypothetical protein [Candidatus Nanosynbacter sp.]
MMKYKRLVLGLGAVLCLGAAHTAPVAAAGGGCGIIDFTGVSCSQEASPKDKGEDNISNLLIGILKIMNIGVGIAAVGALIYAGILYSTASGDANKTAQAKTVITNVVIGILAYAVMGIVLNFLVPGGILR